MVLMHTDRRDAMFRTQALKARDETPDRAEPVLQIAPSWTRLTYRTLLLCLVGLLVYLALARISHFADGTAVIRIGGAQQVSALGSEVVERIHVRPGQQVEAGALLLEFHAREQRDQVEHARQEYLEAVHAWLLQPERAAAVADARGRLRVAEARLRERQLRAAAAGEISDVRVRPGQPVSPGQVLLTQGDSGGGNRATIFLPGQARPRLQEGQTVRLELHGHPFSRINLRLERIDSELIGIEEARSLLGFGLADVLSMSGTLVRAEARIDDPHFEAEGQRFRLHDGMTAQAQVELGSRPLALALVPGTR